MTMYGPDNLADWLLFLLMWPLSCLYGVLAFVRNTAYRLGIFRQYQASVPVISVGNLSTGGTGKTPIVDALAKYLESIGKQVAIVSRGYGGTFDGDYSLVTPGSNEGLNTARLAGDEPYLLALRNPDTDVYVSRVKRYGIMAAESSGIDCILLDDAFQHRPVARNLDIVLLDSRAPFGNGSLLPAGNLRESRKALDRAGLIVLTHADKALSESVADTPTVSSRHSLAKHLVDIDGNSVSWDELIDKRCLAFAGIAHPETFFKALLEKGCHLARRISLQDHQDYDSRVVKKN